MAEFCRVAQVAARSTSLLRSSASRWQSYSLSTIPSPLKPTIIRHISTSPILRLTDNGDNPPPKDPPLSPRSPLSRARFQNYSSLNWNDPFREKQGGEEIKKPDISAYEDPFAPEIDFATGELNKNKFLEERPTPTRPPLRLVPRTGRTVQVTRNADVARSFKLLSIQVSANRVRHDVNRQRYHERPGLKRKRLKSERWQKRFQKGFKACIKRVRELTKQGW
ncbi:hypothetical protein F4774DRAFT_396500 [Daldinia eschscholtzii]|nr:hypothetical protein F4774DRAFT_396500 [Daldinia eschscholtzii]